MVLKEQILKKKPRHLERERKTLMSMHLFAKMSFLSLLIHPFSVQRADADANRLALRLGDGATVMRTQACHKVKCLKFHDLSYSNSIFSDRFQGCCLFKAAIIHFLLSLSTMKCLICNFLGYLY